MIHQLRRPAMLHRQKASRSTLLTRSTKLDEQSMVHQIQTICYTHSGSSFNAFKQITTKEVKDLITASPNNYCRLDPIPTSLVKNCASLLAPYVSHLLNRSLAEGYIPASQKVAVVKPHLTKRGLDIGRVLGQYQI